MSKETEGVKLVGMCEYIEMIQDKPIDHEKPISHMMSYCYGLIMEYCNFLRLTLKLGYFIPCDKDGKPMDEPVDNHTSHDEYCVYMDQMEQYKQACKEVIFVGWTWNEEKQCIIHADGVHFNDNLMSKNNIEFFTNFKCAYLTQTKSLQLGLTIK